jgi:hypothetical protein
MSVFSCAAMAIVDSGANLVMTQRLGTPPEPEARTAVAFRFTTKLVEDTVAQGGIGLRVLTFGASLAEGGLPIIVIGHLVGATGVSALYPTKRSKCEGWSRCHDDDGGRLRCGQPPTAPVFLLGVAASHPPGADANPL